MTTTQRPPEFDSRSRRALAEMEALAVQAVRTDPALTGRVGVNAERVVRALYDRARQNVSDRRGVRGTLVVPAPRRGLARNTGLDPRTVHRVLDRLAEHRHVTDVTPGGVDGHGGPDAVRRRYRAADGARLVRLRDRRPRRRSASWEASGDVAQMHHDVLHRCTTDPDAGVAQMHRAASEACCTDAPSKYVEDDSVAVAVATAIASAPLSADDAVIFDRSVRSDPIRSSNTDRARGSVGAAAAADHDHHPAEDDRGDRHRPGPLEGGPTGAAGTPPLPGDAVAARRMAPGGERRAAAGGHHEGAPRPPGAERALVFRHDDLPPSAAAVYLELTSGGQPAAVIARRIGVHRSTAGRCLDRLAELGLADHPPEGWVLGPADPFSAHSPAAAARAARLRAAHVEHHTKRHAKITTRESGHGQDSGSPEPSARRPSASAGLDDPRALAHRVAGADGPGRGDAGRPAAGTEAAPPGPGPVRGADPYRDLDRGRTAPEFVVDPDRVPAPGAVRPGDAGRDRDLLGRDDPWRTDDGEDDDVTPDAELAGRAARLRAELEACAEPGGVIEYRDVLSIIRGSDLAEDGGLYDLLTEACDQGWLTAVGGDYLFNAS